ncbi:DedA family protein [Streptomyces canus]|uniref:DedA family protein n=1 Tax=Streptomyces canus TaxID=58343 RepID=UPI0037172F6E
MLLLATLVVAGGVTGDNLGYALGRRCKRRPHARLARRIRPGSGIGRAQDFLLRHGGMAVLAGRFIGFVRTFLPFAAGASGMPYRRFFFSTLASLVWGIGNVLLGYFAGAAVTELLHSVGPIAVAGLAAAGAVILVVVRLHRRRRRAVRGRSTVVASAGAP